MGNSKNKEMHYRCQHFLCSVEVSVKKVVGGYFEDEQI